MAQLKDSVVTGNLRITDTTFTDTLQVTTIKAPSTAGGTTHTAGTNGQALMSNGTSTYWGTPVGTMYSAGTGLSLSGTTFNHSNSVTAVTTAGMLKVKYDAQGHITGSSAFAKADVSSLINLLDTGSSNPELADYYIAQYANGGTTTTTYHRRPVSALWNTLKALITVTTTGDGNAITSASIGNDGNNRKITFTKGSTFSLSDHTHSDYVLKTGDSMSGDLLIARNKGLKTKDKTNAEYYLINDNSTNLWIGAQQAASTHHIGNTYISTGYNNTDSVGYSTIKIAVPNATNTGADAYDALHTGNLTVTTSGSGNAVTSVSRSGTTITATKGSTFSLDGHTHSNYLGAVLTGSYYGMAKPDGTATGDTSWIRTTFKGIIPYAANDDATNGLKSQLGTSTWSFAAGHIKNLYYADLKPITVVAGGTADNGIDKMAGSYFFSGDNLFNAGESIDWVGIQAGYSLDKWQMMGTGVKGVLYRQNDSGGSNTENWNDWQLLMTPQAITGSSGITATITTTTIGTGANAYVYNSGVQISHSNSIAAVTTAAFKKYTYDAQGHITGSADVAASDLPSHTHLYAGSSTAGGAATNVATTVTNGTTTLTNYALTYVADPNDSESNVVRKSNDLRVSITNGTTSSGGTAELVIGNNKNTTTANNKQGKISLYSSDTSYHTLAVTATTSAITHTFPATSGTVLNSGTTSFTRSLTSGTKIGSIKINGTSTDIYCETNVWNAMTGATSSADGTVGYINATPPKTGYNTKYWRADGSWVVPVASSSTNGNIKINGTETTVYTHPTATAQSSGLYKITVNGTGHVTAATAVTKTDIPALDYLPNTTAYAVGNSVGGAAMSLASDDCETTTGTYYPTAHKQSQGQYVSNDTAVFSRSCLFLNQVNESSANLFTVILGSHHDSDITVGAVEMYSSSGWQTRVRATSTTFRNVWLPDAEGTLITSEQVAAGYIPLTGSDQVTGDIITTGTGKKFTVKNDTYATSLHIGSGGVNRGVFDHGGTDYSGLNAWALRIDGNNEVGLQFTNKEYTSQSGNLPIPFLSTTGSNTSGTVVSGAKNVYCNNGLWYNSKNGTTSATGTAYLMLGNAKESGTEGNKEGILRIYSTNDKYVQIKSPEVTSDRTVTLPPVGGSLALEKSCMVYGTKDATVTDSNGWFKFAQATLAATQLDTTAVFLISKSWTSNSQSPPSTSGILIVHARTDNSDKGKLSPGSTELKWLIAASGINVDYFKLLNYDTTQTNVRLELWCRIPERWAGWAIKELRENQRTVMTQGQWTLYSYNGEVGTALPNDYTGIKTSSVQALLSSS